MREDKTKEEVELNCAIRDKYIDGKPYNEIVKNSKEIHRRCRWI